jgi:homoserine dehydrogenase
LPLNIVQIGFGNVGRTLAGLLAGETSRYRVLAFCDSSGCAVSNKGFTSDEIDSLLSTPRGSLGKLETGYKGSIHRLINTLHPDVVIDVRPSVYSDPDLEIYALQPRHGYHIVTANKAPLAVEPSLLTSNPYRRRIHYRATFMAGTPLFDILTYGLTGRRVKSVRGVFNTTTTYMLTLSSQGASYEEALSRAIDEGIAEPDPAIDVECIDPAAKASIIAATLGYKVPIYDVERTGLKEYWGIKGFARCVSRIEIKDGSIHVSVSPEELGEGDPLRLAIGKRNAAVVRTVDGNEIIVSGSGGGPMQTAITLFSDLVKASQGLW